MEKVAATESAETGCTDKSNISHENPVNTDALNDDTNNNTGDSAATLECESDNDISCNCVGRQDENASPSDTDSVFSMTNSVQSFTVLSDSPQTSGSRKCCLKQRLWSVFKNELLSDVMFVVGKEEQQEKIPAHKVLLSVASDVFKAQFRRNGAAESPSLYHVPDVEPAAFTALLRFFYLDEVLITSKTVIPILYAARKYAVQSLENHCVDFLIKNLCLKNAVTILDQVMMFNIKRLISSCLEVIDGDTVAAFAADGFPNIEADTLCLLLERDSLTISEIQLFQAVLRWSEAECLRNNLAVDQENQRSVLRGALPLLRFPLMSVEEFSSKVTRSGLLTKEELLSMYLYFTTKPNPAVSFNTTPRHWERITVNRFQSFDSASLNLGAGSACNNTLNLIDFSCNRDIQLLGFGLFGSIATSGKYDLRMQLKNTVTDSSIRDESTVFKFGNITMTYEALFADPIKLTAFTKYTASVTMTGPACLMGTNGSKNVTVALPHCREVTITFETHVSKEPTPDSKTNVDQGQIPQLLFIA